MPVCKYCLEHFGDWDKTKSHEKHCRKNPNRFPRPVAVKQEESEEVEKVSSVDIPEAQEIQNEDAVEAMSNNDIDEIEEAEEAQADPAESESFLMSMKNAELKAYAKEAGIDLGGARNKADLVAAILSAGE